jgi:hypothetical protein
MSTAETIRAIVKPSSRQRSRVGNGSKLLPMTDGRSATYRRFKDLYGDICADDIAGLSIF